MEIVLETNILKLYLTLYCLFRVIINVTDIFVVASQNEIRVKTKLPNSEQSYKGKVKTYKYINRQNQSTTGKLKTVMTLTWYRLF